MASGPPLIPLNELDSAFQLQEHIKALHNHLQMSPDGGGHKIAITKEAAIELATLPELENGERVEKNLWLYELCRLLVTKTNALIVGFGEATPKCEASTPGCAEMRASEWQYLCAVHDPPKSCAAFDYCCHTLDWAANILTSPKHFPSRLTLSVGAEVANSATPHRQLVNIFRRVYRIFAHAWFAHNEVFWSVEAKHGLYIFFKTVCDTYQLIPDESYTIPPEAERAPGDHDVPLTTQQPSDIGNPVHVLQRPVDASHPNAVETSEQPADASTASSTVSTVSTTRRHKHTPSTGSHVTTIAEGTEEDDDITESLDRGRTVAATTNTNTTAVESVSGSGAAVARLSSGIGAMSLGAGSMPVFDEDAAFEDPTPTAHGHGVDPFEEAEVIQEPDGEGDVLGAILGHMAGPGEAREESQALEPEPTGEEAEEPKEHGNGEGPAEELTVAEAGAE